MIISNGTYSFLSIVDGGGTDELGRPIQPKAEWSIPRPCQIQTASENRMARNDDGVYTKASFILLVDLQPFPYERIKLERMGENLGEFDVISAEPLEAVQQTKVVV